MSSNLLKLLRMNVNEYRRSGDNVTQKVIRNSLAEVFNQPDAGGHCSKIAPISQAEYEATFNIILGEKYRRTRR